MLNVQRAARAQREALGATGFQVDHRQWRQRRADVMHLPFHAMPTLLRDKPLDLDGWRAVQPAGDRRRCASRALADAWPHGWDRIATEARPSWIGAPG